jgi:hypothetical protein
MSPRCNLPQENLSQTTVDSPAGAM